MKLVGVAEVLGAIRLILPALLGIAPLLVPLTAIRLLVLTVGAAIPMPGGTSRG